MIDNMQSIRDAALTPEQRKAFIEQQFEQHEQDNRDERERIKQYQIKLMIDNITLAYNTIYKNLIILGCYNNSSHSLIEKSYTEIINRLIEQYSFLKKDKLLPSKIY